MEKHEIEKNWDDFWLSGRVDDYLSYRNSIGKSETHIKEADTDGRVSECDRDGINCHANIGI